MAADTAERFGDIQAIVDADVALSYADLDEAACAFAAALVASGVQPGDRVAIWHHNSVEWVIAALGLWRSGAILIPINTRFKGREAADILQRSRARVLVTPRAFLGNDYVALLRSAGLPLPLLETVVVTGDEGPDHGVPWADFARRPTPDAVAEVDRRRAAVGPHDPSDILFTSGTTGRPKGVVMTHSRTLRVATDWVRMTGLQAGDRYLMVNPYFHMFGLKAGILACLASGATMLPEPVFDVDRVLGRVAAERVSVLPGPPTLYQSILDHPDRSGYDLSSLRVAVTGAADIPVSLVRRVYAELPFSVMVSGYGLTEAGTASGTAPGDDEQTVATTVGRARPGFEIRIVDPAGKGVPSGETGEILLRGASVMLEYLDDPEATAVTLSDDGWLRTGDVGTLDESGLLRIVGRVKDMFIAGGFNVYPAEIEDALRRHPDVRDAAVVGMPDPRLGEVGLAYVVRSPEATLSTDELIGWCRAEMANYKVPRAVEFVAELPRNATGKVVKDELRARAASR